MSKGVCNDSLFSSRCRFASDSLLCFLIYVAAPQQVQFLQQAKMCKLQPKQPVHCCWCKELQISIFASDQLCDGYAILMTLQLRSALSPLRLQNHVALANSVDYH